MIVDADGGRLRCSGDVVVVDDVVLRGGRSAIAADAVEERNDFVAH